MAHDDLRKKIEQLLTVADVRIDGDRAWDIRVWNDDFYPRLFAQGSLALGESYMAGWWDCDSLDTFFYRVLRAELDKTIRPWREALRVVKSRFVNSQKPSRAFEVGLRHYDIGNTLYRHMLGRWMIYSCGYWDRCSTLDEAQEAKLDLVCRKLGLRPGMRVLDIGCGWGGTAKFAAERYEVEVVGITVSEEQARVGKETCRGLPVDIRLQDYRSVEGQFDRILSLGMFEHVGYKNYLPFLRVVRGCLKDDGLFLLHTIGNNRSVTKVDPWIERYIFPNSMIPSATQICAGIEGLFVLEDWHNFGADYDTTLIHWFRNFREHWDVFRSGYGETFYRMWKYYLLSCAGAFRARNMQVWQVVLSPQGVPGRYRCLR